MTLFMTLYVTIGDFISLYVITLYMSLHVIICHYMS